MSVALLLAAVVPLATPCVPHTRVCFDGADVAFRGHIDAARGGTGTLTLQAPTTLLGVPFGAGAVDVSYAFSPRDGRVTKVLTLTGTATADVVVDGVPVAAGRVAVVDVEGAAGRGVTVVDGVTAAPAAPSLWRVPVRLPPQVHFSLSLVDEKSMGLRVEPRVTHTQQGEVVVDGLAFAGTAAVHVRREPHRFERRGLLARAATLGGVEVSGAVDVAVDAAGAVTVVRGTVTRATPLSLLFGALEGEVAASTSFVRMPASLTLEGAGGATVCGVRLSAVSGAPHVPAVLQLSQDSTGIVVDGAFVDVVVDGARFSGSGRLRFARTGCALVGVAATLAAPTEVWGLPLAQGPVQIAPHLPPSRARFLTARLANAVTVDGFDVAGDVVVDREGEGPVRLWQGKLVRNATLPGWEVPAGSGINRSSATTFSFTTSGTRGARATAPVAGVLFDGASEVHVTPDEVSVRLLRPARVHGAMTSSVLVRGALTYFGAERDVQLAGLRVPAGAALTLCNGALQHVHAQGAVPTIALVVDGATVFAEEVVAGSRDATPTGDAVVRPCAERPTGRWLQLASRCNYSGGPPHGPPPRRWVFVDDVAAPDAAQAAMLKAAQTKGKPCVQERCCRP